MAIQKTTLVSLIGRLESLDDVVLKLSTLDYFHPEKITTKDGTSFKEASGENPYSEPLDDVRSVCAMAGIDLSGIRSDRPATNTHDFDLEAAKTYIRSYKDTYKKAVALRDKVQQNVQDHQMSKSHLEMLHSLNTSFDELFSSKFLKVRFGKLPLDSMPKLAHYDDRLFFVFPFAHDKAYQWCLYLTDERHSAEADSIMDALFFERVRIPDYLHGSPDDAAAYLEDILKKETAQLQSCQQKIDGMRSENQQKLTDLYKTVKFLSETYSVRRYVGTSYDKFALGEYFEFVGYVPKDRESDFESLFGDIKDVTVNIDRGDDGAVPMLPGLITVSSKRAHDTGVRAERPTKLKNGWFSRPFEMYVEMYGVPSHSEIDPTPFVAVTYTLLFGIMFGDVGQGVVVAILGYLFAKWKKSRLGEIIMRMGICSALFGFVYGSVFGFEHALDGLYHALGFAEKPVEVMNAATINVLLVVAVAIGVVLILGSMLLNIYIGLKNRDYTKALFSQNGVAGFVLYATVIAAIGLPILGVSFSLNAPIILLCLVVPGFCIFLKEPLGHLCQKTKAFPEGVGGYILESIFEMLEIAISFVANTMSFLRVGGFILSHAGMMSVVFTLAGMFTGAGNIIVTIVANLFVIGLEGLIVGIQVLRLEFYEMFGRYYSGDGVPFTPISAIVHENAAA